MRAVVPTIVTYVPCGSAHARALTRPRSKITFGGKTRVWAAMERQNYDTILKILHRFRQGAIEVDDSQFWEIIDDAGKDVCSSAGLPDSEPRMPNAKFEMQFIASLRQILENLTLDEIIQFRDEFERKTLDLYCWDLWAVAFVIHHGCSDDYFDSCIAWIVCQGRDFYLKVLNDPCYIADTSEPGNDLVFESVGYLPYEIYEEKAQEELAGSGMYCNKEPSGKAWNYSELPRLLPKVCEKFGFSL